MTTVPCNTYLHRVVAVSGWKWMFARIAAAAEEHRESADLQGQGDTHTQCLQPAKHHHKHQQAQRVVCSCADRQRA
jgi:hypothetical protein